MESKLKKFLMQYQAHELATKNSLRASSKLAPANLINILGSGRAKFRIPRNMTVSEAEPWKEKFPFTERQRW
jgi:hypothetical protein